MDESKPEITLQYIIDNCLAHPAAELFPELPDEELQELADDIEKNGLLEPIALYAGPYANYICDGLNRIWALDRIPQDKRPNPIPVRWIDADDVISFVISKNLRRRHLTKQEKVELITCFLHIDLSSDRLSANPSVKDEKGQLQGTIKNPERAKLVEEAAKVGVSEATVKTTIAKARGVFKPRPKQATFIPAHGPSPAAVRRRLGNAAETQPVKHILQWIKERAAQQPCDWKGCSDRFWGGGDDPNKFGWAEITLTWKARGMEGIVFLCPKHFDYLNANLASRKSRKIGMNGNEGDPNGEQGLGFFEVDPVTGQLKLKAAYKKPIKRLPLTPTAKKKIKKPLKQKVVRLPLVKQDNN